MRNDTHMIEECTTAHFDINITECVLYDNTCSPMLFCDLYYASHIE